jgi:hypothetical protein
MTCRRTKYKDRVDELQKRENTTKSRVRSMAEHPSRILKRIFGFDTVRYREIAKNHNRLCANFALINLSHHRKRLAVLAAQVRLGGRKRPPDTSNQATGPPTPSLEMEFQHPPKSARSHQDLCRPSLKVLLR